MAEIVRERSAAQLRPDQTKEARVRTEVERWRGDAFGGKRLEEKKVGGVRN